MVFRLTLFLLLATIGASTYARSSQRLTTIAVLSFGDSDLGRQASEALANSLRSPNLQVFDADQTRAAARGAGYLPTLNMAVPDARTFGAVLGSDFYIVGDAQTLRRSPSNGKIYFESYASIFLVSSRTGRLASWQRPSFQSPNLLESQKLLLTALTSHELNAGLLAALHRAQEQERTAREQAVERDIPIIEAAPDDDEAAAAQGMRLPRPFRRLQPAYPDSAAAAEAEAVVDVLVDLDANGEVSRVEIARWAGFGLDEVTLDTVRKLHFFPAMRNGTAIPLRVLLRYNFRKPPK